MQKVNLDKADKLLIYQLEDNCRESITKIARKIGVSKQVVLYKIRRLKEAGIIRMFSIVIDESKLRLMHFEVYLQLSSINPERKKELEQYLYDHPQVTYLSEVGSPFDLLAGISVREIAEFYDEMKRLNRRFPQLIQNYFVSITGEAVSYPRSYLLGKEDEERSKRFLISQKPKKVEFDRTDARVLNELSWDSRIPTIHLAKKLRISPTTLRQKLRRMEKDGIIQAYRAVIEPTLIGVQPYELLIATQNMDEMKEKELETFFRLNPRVTVVLRLIGRWDVDVVFDTDNFQDYQNFMTEIRTRFGPYIKDHVCSPVLKLFRHNYQVELPD